ncbi:glycosyl transferase [Bacteroidia bacterium]|nr:glycosyl transferase [Bacteroidia bacterium]
MNKIVAYLNMAPIVLFVYNRPEATQKAIEALQSNLLASETELYIFSDAAKDETVKEKVIAVRKIIHSINGFKTITIIEAGENKGLANSVIDGVSVVLQKYGKAIVLEDDLITSPNFLSFMNQALDFYADNQQVISISGLTFRVDVPKDYQYGVYYTHRMSSYGWGTWLDRWEAIDWNVNDYNSFKYNLKKNLQFMKGGEDLPRMLAAYMKGKINSWAIRFCYHQYKTGTYTVYPTQSKVDNIGFGKKGTNTVRQKKYDVIDFAESCETVFSFPDKVFINRHINKSFLRKYRTINRIIANYFVKK